MGKVNPMFVGTSQSRERAHLARVIDDTPSEIPGTTEDSVGKQASRQVVLWWNRAQTCEQDKLMLIKREGGHGSLASSVIGLRMKRVDGAQCQMLE